MMQSHPGARIHPSAIVEDGAVISDGCDIGPFVVIGPHVVLGPRVQVRSHAVVTGRTEVGADSVIYSHAVVGEAPQDLTYKGEPTRLVIGARCQIREGATLNIGTARGRGITRVGDDCMFMTGAHVGHDVLVGNRVVMANQAALAGHCTVGDGVMIGGLSGVHQHVRIGNGAMIGAVTMVTHDVIPYGLVQGARGRLEGLNLVGLKRRGLDRAELTVLRAAYVLLAEGNGSLHERARELMETSPSTFVREMAAFLLEDTERSFLKPR